MRVISGNAKGETINVIYSR